MKRHTERLGTAPLGRLLVALSLPGIAATISTTLYNIVDTIWVARIGHEAIAALTIVFPYQILFYAIGGGTGTGIGALVSRRFGERKTDEANRVAGQIFFLSAVWGLLFILIALFLADDVLRLIGAKADFMDFARQYFTITSWGAPLMIFAILVASLLRGSGDTVKPMVIMISATVINIILDPLMIQGIGPFPEMKVAGAAWATVIAQGFAALMGLFFLFWGNTSYRIRIKHLMPKLRLIGEIYHVGAPSAVLQLTESLAFALFNVVAASYGSLTVAAVGIVMRVSDFAFMPVMGISQGLLPIVGYCFGEGNYKRLWSAFVKATIGVTGLLVILTIGMEVFAPQIIGIFAEEEALVTVSVPAMRIMLSSMVFIGPSILVVTTFQALSRGNTALVLSLLRQFIVFLPFLYLFSYLFGELGIWLCMPASDIVGILFSGAFILREYRKHQKLGLLEKSPMQREPVAVK